MTSAFQKRMARARKKSISEWLGMIGSHEIYDSKSIAEDFKDKTGEEPCWSVHTAKEIRAAIKRRGLGGGFDGKASGVAGYEIASDLAKKFTDFYSDKMGRGGIFYDCLEAIKKAGK